MKNKPLLLPALGAAALLALVVSPRPSQGQAGTDGPVMTTLVADLVKQQTQVEDNQTKIEAKLVEIAENLRIARIFTARGGGKTP